MNKFFADLTALSCKQFSRRVATGEPLVASLAEGGPALGGIYWRLQFWTHWVICEFCRRYWEELKMIGNVHKKNSTLSQDTMRQLPLIKQRLQQRFKDL